MIDYFLGIITGLVVAVLISIVLKRNEPLIVKKLLQANTRLVASKNKAQFFEPTDEKVEALEQIIQENNKKGIDTKMEDD